jgi:hypothetical protein
MASIAAKVFVHLSKFLLFFPLLEIQQLHLGFEPTFLFSKSLVLEFLLF